MRTPVKWPTTNLTALAEHFWPPTRPALGSDASSPEHELYLLPLMPPLALEIGTAAWLAPVLSWAPKRGIGPPSAYRRHPL